MTAMKRLLACPEWQAIAERRRTELVHLSGPGLRGRPIALGSAATLGVLLQTYATLHAGKEWHIGRAANGDFYVDNGLREATGDTLGDALVEALADLWSPA